MTADNLVDEIGNDAHLGLLHPARCQRGSADANSAGDEGRLIVEGDSVFIDRNSCGVESFLGIFSRDIFVTKVDEHQMIIRSPRNNIVPFTHQRFGKSLRILDDLF